MCGGVHVWGCVCLCVAASTGSKTSSMTKLRPETTQHANDLAVMWSTLLSRKRDRGKKSEGRRMERRFVGENKFFEIENIISVPQSLYVCVCVQYADALWV